MSDEGLSPADLGLPFPTWWPLQRETIFKILGAFSGGARFVTLEAPPGSGKSGIAIGLARLLSVPTVVLTSTKTLQDQYTSGFGIPEIRGRSNFKCVIEPVMASAAPCTVGTKCHMQGVNGADGCPYYDAKRGALEAPIYTTNYSYHLAESNYIGDFPPSELVICDEAHNLQSHIRDFCTVPRPVGVAEDRVGLWATAYQEQATRMDGSGPGFQTREEKRKVQKARQYAALLRMDAEWVIHQDKAIPVWVSPFLSRYFLSHAVPKTGKFLFISATIGDPSTFADELGIEKENLTSFSVPSQFPKSGRPIKYRSVGKVSATNEGSFARVSQEVERILADHVGERGLVHTVSYALSSFLKEACSSPRLLFPTASTLAKDLAQYRATPDAVLVSPSVSTGVDLPYDLCRFQVIAKLPFPSLGDPVRREQGKTPRGKALSTRDTAQTFVQTYGRGMRAADDMCVTYLLDGNWQWFQRSAESEIPKYIMEAFT